VEGRRNLNFCHCIIVTMAPYDDDDVLMPLVGGDSSNNNRGNGNNGASGQLINRILILITLAALVAVSVFFQSSSSQLSQQLESDESKIQQLQDTVKSQAFVIERFNHSVSNSDVLKQLKTIELNLETTQHELNDELDAVEQEVTIKLEKTLKELDQTVQAAENEIQDQVDTVKKNFDKYVVVTQDQFSMENSFMVYQLAGTFTLLACLISMWHMTAHLRKLKQPVIQRRILSILWMPPIYAITSWFSLVFTPAEGYLAIIKDAYEAYIIYQVSTVLSVWNGMYTLWIYIVNLEEDRVMCGTQTPTHLPTHSYIIIPLSANVL
jgi:FlaG/FlaF family flagellin (archaellin)